VAIFQLIRKNIYLLVFGSHQRNFVFADDQHKFKGPRQNRNMDPTKLAKLQAQAANRIGMSA
jgi:hypothetical protein